MRKNRHLLILHGPFPEGRGLPSKSREFTPEMPCVCHENARHLCLKCLAFQEQTSRHFF